MWQAFRIRFLAAPLGTRTGTGERACGRAVMGNPRNPLIRLIRDSDTVGR